MTKLERPVKMAVIGAAHGIKGEVRVKSFTGDPMALAEYGPLFTKAGRAFEIEDIRPQKEVVVVQLKGVRDRTAAEALNGTELFVDRSRLPPEEEGEYYHDDLIGLTVQDEVGAAIGKVTAVQNFGGGDLLEIALGARKDVLIPFTEAAVTDVSVAGGFIRVDPLAAGLVDAEEGEENERGFNPTRRNRGPKEAGGNR